MWRNMEHVIFHLVFIVCTIKDVNASVIQHIKFKPIPCSQFNFQVIQIANPVQQYQRRSLLECAKTCSKTASCHHAVFRGSVKQCIHLLYGEDSISENPSYAQETGCVVLDRVILHCQNGGVAIQYTCQCPESFRGKQCEEANPEFCQSGTTKRIGSPSSYKRFPIKFKLPMNSDTVIHTLTYYDTGKFQLFPSLTVDPTTKRFQIPVRKKLNIIDDYGRGLKTIFIQMTGEMESSTAICSLNLWSREKNDGDASIGSVTELMEGFSKGYKLMNKEPTMVSFDKANEDAYYESVRKMVDMSDNSLLISWKTVLKSQKIFQLRKKVNVGDFHDKTTLSAAATWNLDKCWVRLVSDSEVTNALKEYVLRGYDVRLVIGESISIDVTMVTVTNSDVIVALADHLLPFDDVSSLDQDSRIRFTLLGGVSKVRATCEMAFLGSTVYGKTANAFSQSVEWFVNSVPSTQFLTVNSNGETTGSIDSIYNAAMSGRDIRVCLEMPSSQTICSGTTVVYAENDGHVAVQTPAVLKPDTDATGKLVGVANCKRIVRQISTKGWVEEVTYTIGEDVLQEDITNVIFVISTWFII